MNLCSTKSRIIEPEINAKSFTKTFQSIMERVKKLIDLNLNLKFLEVNFIVNW